MPVYAKQGVKALEDWLVDPRRKQHQKRQRAPNRSQTVVRILRRELRLRAELSAGQRPELALVIPGAARDLLWFLAFCCRSGRPSVFCWGP